MAKTHTKNIRFPLTLTGYILFSVLIVGVLLSTTIPFGKLLFNPQVLHTNVLIATIALTVGAFLPALLGYLIGDHSVKSKSRLSHHFNGVLFGLLAYWIMILSTTFISFPSELFGDSINIRLILINIVPSIVVVCITTALAVAHVRSRHAKHDLLDYTPYRVLLIGFLLLMPLGALVNNIVTQSLSVYSFVPFVATGVIGVLSYIMLRKTTLGTHGKLTWAAISVSVAYVSLFVSQQLIFGLSYYVDTMPTMEFQTIVSSLAWIVGIVGWIIFWRIQTKALARKK